MQAIVCTRYGPPEVLQLAEVPTPTPRANQIRVKIHATTVTASDTILRGFKMPRWSMMGIMMSLVMGIRKPRSPILGMILAGEVDAVGSAVKRFKVGDPVYGHAIKPPFQIRTGTYAEYMCLREDSFLVPKPANLSYEEAAAIPYGAGLALFFLKMGHIQPGQRVLVYGASGAIGTAAVQLLKHHYGADVTGVCSARNAALVESLGADRVIDYTRSDAADQLGQYAVVFDAVGHAKTSALKEQSKQAITPGGHWLSVDEGSPTYDTPGLMLLNTLIEAGKFRAVIDRTYPLAEMVAAHRYVDAGHKSGNVVIRVVSA
jgi:NADPH:quinone reductase-like Zn-dependent oxidoreductase